MRCVTAFSSLRGSLQSAPGCVTNTQLTRLAAGNRSCCGPRRSTGAMIPVPVSISVRLEFRIPIPQRAKHCTEQQVVQRGAALLCSPLEAARLDMLEYVRHAAGEADPCGSGRPPARAV